MSYSYFSISTKIPKKGPRDPSPVRPILKGTIVLNPPARSLAPTSDYGGATKKWISIQNEQTEEGEGPPPTLSRLSKSTLGVTHLRDTIAIHLIVKSGERSTPCGCPLHSLGSRGVAPKTRGPGNASNPATPPGCRTHCQTGECDTLAGSLKALLGDPQGVEGVWKGLCTSVTASRMTDA